MKTTITRFAGYSPSINGMPVACWPPPGGGYEGLTKKLDRAVSNAARFLASQFGLPVTIRFNSDRRSGSAFLVDKKHLDASVGLGAHLKMPEHIRTKWLNSPLHVPLDKLWKPNEQSEIGFTVYIHVDFLVNPEDRGDRGGKDHGYWFCPNGASARRLFLKRLNVPHMMNALTLRHGKKAAA